MTYTLLCVDDDSQKLNTITALLRREGYDVITAPVGAEALKLFAEKHIDLAVVDHYMPGMSGDVLAAEMKRIKAAVPVVLFSGSFNLPEMVIAIVDGFVSSSEDFSALLNKIAELLPPRQFTPHQFMPSCSGPDVRPESSEA